MAASRSPKLASDRPLGRRNGAPFSEAQAWGKTDGGWQHLHGSFADQGYSLEWHDFAAKAELDWTSSFHPGGLEICLNLSGQGTVRDGTRVLEFAPLTAGFYFQDQAGLTGRRFGSEQHQFITVELSHDFLRRNLQANDAELDPALRRILEGKAASYVSEPIRLTSEHQLLVRSLRHPPVYASAQRLWYRAKALEVASVFFYRPAVESELFCQRQKLLNQERVQKVVAMLRENVAETPALEAIGKRVGCSHYHLSRIFSQETGQSIFQYLRRLRMERAAELLREGRLNVTQVSLEVGYSSLSHFSMAFHESYGCCPGLFPLATPTQKAGAGK